MKKTLFLLALLLISGQTFAQYAAVVRKTALAMLHADERKDYPAYVDFFYPSEIKARGGKAKFIKAMSTREADLKRYGLKLPTESLGKISKFYQAGKEIHCTIESLMKNGRHLSRSHFLVISSDQGKTWKFIMTYGRTPTQVWAMVPKFNDNLTWVDYNEEL